MTSNNLYIGKRVDLDSMDEIYDTLIVLGDIDEKNNTGVIKYIGTSDSDAAKIIRQYDPVCVIDNPSIKERVSYDG